MVPRRPLSAFDTTDNKKRANQAAAKKRADDPNAGEPSPPPPEDMDERLIFDAHRLANQYINDMVGFYSSRLIIKIIIYLILVEQRTSSC